MMPLANNVYAIIPGVAVSSVCVATMNRQTKPARIVGGRGDTGHSYTLVRGEALHDDRLPELPLGLHRRGGSCFGASTFLAVINQWAVLRSVTSGRSAPLRDKNKNNRGAIDLARVGGRQSRFGLPFEPYTPFLADARGRATVDVANWLKLPHQRACYRADSSIAKMVCRRWWPTPKNLPSLDRFVACVGSI